MTDWNQHHLPDILRSVDQVRALLDAWGSVLPPRYHRVLEARYPAGAARPVPYRLVTQTLGWTTERVRQHCARAVILMRRAKRRAEEA